MTPAAAQLSVIGETVKLSAEVRDQAGRVMAGAAVTWTSSDPAVVSVSASGLATAAGNGTVTVTAASGSASGSARVVVAVPAASVVVAPDTVAMSALGDTVRLVAEVRDAAGRPLGGAGVAWVSGDTLVATVDSTGLVAAAGNGTATITATSGEVSAAASVVVEQSVGSLTVSPPDEVIAPGDTLRLEALAVDANGHAVEEAEISWSSSNPSVADVDASGTVRGFRRGAATITAASDKARATSRITVGSPDRTALEALYDVTNGPDWTNSENWLTDAPLDEWYGVDTNAAGRVLRVDLVDNALRGWIPAEFRRLARLEELRLGRNQLRGPIPPELGDLSDLEVLDLSHNQMLHPLPPELGGLRDLRMLDLGHNRFTDPLPPELGGLVELRALYLDHNRLTGPLPPELGGLARLEILALSRNEFAGSVPAELGSLAGLSKLDLEANPAMSGPLPTSLTNLRSLEALYTRGTGLCAPGDDADFQAWLAGVPDADVADCASAAAYLVQTVQSWKFPVPLLAGEDAELRVFVTAAQESDERIPAVRARLYLDGTETRVVDIPRSRGPIPTEINEGDRAKSADATISGDMVRPGLEMVIEVDPDGTLDPALGVAERIPATGRLAVEVYDMPRFDLTVIPFLWVSEPDSSVIGIADEMASNPEEHRLLRATLKLLPVADIVVTAHAPVTSSSNSGVAVLRETDAIRVLEGGGGHHMGLMADFSDVGGIARTPGRVSASVPNGGTIAHELGHNVSLLHAPCGDVGSTADPRYPYPEGSIGAWGYAWPGEFYVFGGGGGGLVHPQWKDLMGYCSGDWISDYHFTNALRHRLLDEGAAAKAVAAVPTRSLLVWGGVDPAGKAFLNPAFVVDAPVALPDSAGAYTVTGRDAGGGELFSLSFAMPVLADAEGASSFVFAVPAEAAWEGRLASVTLSGPSGEVVLDGETNRPMAILRDPASGQVRGFFSELSQDVGTAAAAAAAIDAEPGMRVLFSRGIPDAAAWRR